MPLYVMHVANNNIDNSNVIGVTCQFTSSVRNDAYILFYSEVVAGDILSVLL